MAPEVHEGLGHDFKSDVWSAGIVLYVMVHGFLPFKGLIKDIEGNFLKEDEQFKELGREIISNKYMIEESLSWSCKDLIGRILNLECPELPEPTKDAEGNEVQATVQITERITIS